MNDPVMSLTLQQMQMQMQQMMQTSQIAMQRMAQQMAQVSSMSMMATAQMVNQLSKGISVLNKPVMSMQGSQIMTAQMANTTYSPMIQGFVPQVNLPGYAMTAPKMPVTGRVLAASGLSLDALFDWFGAMKVESMGKNLVRSGVVGGLGYLGGILGTAAGPIGTSVGAASGRYLGERLLASTAYLNPLRWIGSLAGGATSYLLTGNYKAGSKAGWGLGGFATDLIIWDAISKLYKGTFGRFTRELYQPIAMKSAIMPYEKMMFRAGTEGARAGGGLDWESREELVNELLDLQRKSTYEIRNAGNKVISIGLQTGYFGVVKSTKEFKNKFKDLLKSTDVIIKTLNNSVEEAVQLASNLKKMGIKSPEEIKRILDQTATGAAQAGLSFGQMYQLGVQGAQMVQGTGVKLSRGYELALQGMTTTNAAINSGAISEETIRQVGGTTQAGQLTAQVLGMFLKSGQMKAIMAAVYNPETNKIDVDKLNKVIRSGNLVDLIGKGPALTSKDLVKFEANYPQLVSQINATQTSQLLYKMTQDTLNKLHLENTDKNRAYVLSKIMNISLPQAEVIAKSLSPETLYYKEEVQKASERELAQKQAVEIWKREYGFFGWKHKWRNIEYAIAETKLPFSEETIEDKMSRMGRWVHYKTTGIARRISNFFKYDIYGLRYKERELVSRRGVELAQEHLDKLVTHKTFDELLDLKARAKEYKADTEELLIGEYNKYASPQEITTTTLPADVRDDLLRKANVEGMMYLGYKQGVRHKQVMQADALVKQLEKEGAFNTKITTKGIEYEVDLDAVYKKIDAMNLSEEEKNQMKKDVLRKIGMRLKGLKKENVFQPIYDESIKLKSKDKKIVEDAKNKIDEDFKRREVINNIIEAYSDEHVDYADLRRAATDRYDNLATQYLRKKYSDMHVKETLGMSYNQFKDLLAITGKKVKNMTEKDARRVLEIVKSVRNKLGEEGFQQLRESNKGIGKLMNEMISNVGEMYRIKGNKEYEAFKIKYGEAETKFAMESGINWDKVSKENIQELIKYLGMPNVKIGEKKLKELHITEEQWKYLQQNKEEAMHRLKNMVKHYDYNYKEELGRLRDYQYIQNLAAAGRAQERITRLQQNIYEYISGKDTEWGGTLEAGALTSKLGITVGRLKSTFKGVKSTEEVKEKALELIESASGLSDAQKQKFITRISEISTEKSTEEAKKQVAGIFSDIYAKVKTPLERYEVQFKGTVFGGVIAGLKQLIDQHQQENIALNKIAEALTQ